MAIYTYDDFQKAIQANGLAGNFSDADLRLAQTNPDAGMSLLKYKLDYNNATTAEQKALANIGAENIRSSYGGYTGGANGGSFRLEPLSPASYQPAETPTYSNQYAADIKKLYEQQNSYGNYSYDQPQPEYQNRFDDRIQEKTNEILNRPEFSYDPKTDPLWQATQKQYLREGQRATQDALGAAAAASGGIPSSYAVGAATQAGDYYNAQLMDRLPEYWQRAYNQYLTGHDLKLSDLGVLQGLEQSDYDKFKNSLSQYNIDRDSALQTYLSNYNMANDKLQTAIGLEQLEYAKYLNELNQYNTDRNFNYGVLLDEINSQTAERQEAMNNALAAAEFGDYSRLNKMGINTDNNPANFERQYALAQLAAEYGDYSGLRALGVSPDAAGLYNFKAAAAGKMPSGTMSSSSGGGGGSRSSGSSRSAGSAASSATGGGGGGLSAAEVAVLRDTYKGYNIPSDGWESILQSSPGVTEAMLLAAGFKKIGNGFGGYDSSIEAAGKEFGHNTNKSTTQWVEVPEIGKISWSELEKGIDSGLISERKDPKTGLWIYAKK